MTGSTDKLASLPRVVAVGGLVGDDSAEDEISTTAVEVLDLSTMKWDASAGVPHLPHVREWYSTCSSSDGRIIVCGGYDEAPKRAEPLRRRSAVEWLPGTHTWSQLPDLPEGRTSAAIVSLLDGRTLLIGGVDSSLEKEDWALASVLALSVDRTSWTALSPMAECRDAAAAALLPDGKVIVVGGQTGESADTCLRTAECWDPTTENWSPLPPMAHTRKDASVCVLPSGRLAVVGGATTTVEVYDPARGVWELLTAMPRPCSNPLASVSTHAVPTTTGLPGMPLTDCLCVQVPGGLLVVSCMTEDVPGTNVLGQLYDEASGKWFELPHGMVRSTLDLDLIDKHFSPLFPSLDSLQEHPGGLRPTFQPSAALVLSTQL